MAINETVSGDNSTAITGNAKGNYSAGVRGNADLWGVYGSGTVGVRGDGSSWHGVEGYSASTSGGFGVYGHNTAGGTGVAGVSNGWIGVYGESYSTTGGSGIWGEHKNGGNGVVGIGHGCGAGIYGKGGRVAGYFEGDVEITGDIRLLNADCAEDFNIGTEELVEPGSVMVVGQEGLLFPSQFAYDKRVAGVVSGAGDYKPGIVLDKQSLREHSTSDTQISDRHRQPIALLGKVFCKVDAQYGAVEIGDLLTTSPTPGHAMKALDSTQAFGAVIGKALRSLPTGQELIPILITLQ